MNNDIESKELSSLEGTRGQFNDHTGAIKLGIDVHQAFYVVVMQEGRSHPKPAQRMSRAAFLSWAAKLRRTHPGAALHAVYEGKVPSRPSFRTVHDKGSALAVVLARS